MNKWFKYHQTILASCPFSKEVTTASLFPSPPSTFSLLPFPIHKPLNKLYILLPKSPNHLFLLVFPHRVSQCCHSYPGTHSVDQAGLKLRSTYLCLPSAITKGVYHNCVLVSNFENILGYLFLMRLHNLLNKMNFI